MVSWDATLHEVAERLRVLTATATRHRQAGRYRAAVRVVAQCHRILRTLGDSRVALLGRELLDWRVEWALCFSLAGDHVLARRAWERVWDEARSHGDVRLAEGAAAGVALIHAFEGDRRYAQIWLRRARDTESASTTAIRAAASAVLAIEDLDISAALHHAPTVRILEASEAWGIPVYIDARIAGLHGDRGAAKMRLRASCLAHNPRSWERGLNAFLVTAATDALTDSDAEQTGPREATQAGSVGEISDALQRARQAFDHGDLRTTLRLTREVLSDPSAGIRATVTAQLLNAAADPTNKHFTTQVRAALTVAMDEHLYALLRSLLLPPLLPEMQSFAAKNPELARKAMFLVHPLSEAGARPTQRERVVWWYLTTELSLEQIATAEFVSRNTIKSQVAQLYKKLGVRNRSDATRLANEDPAGPLSPATTAS